MFLVTVKRRELILSAVAFALVVITAITVVCLPRTRRLALGVRSGVSLAGVGVGGLYPDELRRVVLNLASSIEREPRDAVFFSETGEIIGDEHGVVVDVDNTIAMVMAAHRGVAVDPLLRATSPKVTKSMLKPVYKVHSTEPSVALVFNVAWGEEWIPSLLSALKQAGAKSTFFITGTWAKKFPDLLGSVLADGHEIANHGWDHPHLFGLSDSSIERLIHENEVLIRQLTGVRTTLFAPPYGEVDQRITSIAARLGYTTVMWTVDTIDWKHPLPGVIVERALAKLAAGNIVLMHPTEPTATALPTILSRLRENGYTAVTVSRLFESANEEQ